MQRSFVFAAVAALLLSALLRADDAYPIKARDVAEGDVYQVQKTETATGTTKLAPPGGQALEEKHTSVTTTTYTETILKCEPKKNPTAVERKYDKATEETDGKTKELLYQGKTVRIEKKDGKFHFSIDGKELTDEDVPALAKEFDQATDGNVLEALLPKDPVKVNDTWKVDLASFIKDAAHGEMEMDADKAKGTGTLLKVSKKGDQQYGEIKLNLTLPLKSLGKGKKKITANPGSVTTVEMNMDICIDGTSGTGSVKGTNKVDLKGSVPDGKGGNLDLTLAVQAKTEEIRKQLPKK